MASLCFGCFREINREGQCPHCGYDPKADEGKFGAAIKSGEILNERYIVGRVMGQGGFGVTYAALDFATQQRVAIKEFFPTALVSREVSGTVSAYSAEMEAHFTQGKAGFLEEAHTLEKLKDSEHIVNVLNFFEENGTAYFVMDYVQGQNLKAYVKIMGGRLGQEAANRILLPIMEAMEDVHAKGIVHRDIAPDNIIVTAEGSATLIDFGAARYSTGEKSMSLDVVLKHGYAPKEQYSRRSRQGPYTDIYAMAATYYYAVTGRVPPDAIDRTGTDELQPPSALGAKLSPAAEAAVLKALSVEPVDRFQTMGDFIKALKGEKLPEKKKEKEKKTGKKPKGKVLAFIVPVLLLAAVFAVTGLLPDKKDISLPEPAATQAPAVITPTAETPAPEPEELPEAEEPSLEAPAPEPEELPEAEEPSFVFEETEIYNSDGVRIRATEADCQYDRILLTFSIDNNTERELCFTEAYLSVNSCLSVSKTGLYETVPGGQSKEAVCYIPMDEIRAAGIDRVYTVDFLLRCYDTTDYDTWFCEPTSLRLYEGEPEVHSLLANGEPVFDEKGLIITRKDLPDGGIELYVENNSSYYIQLLYTDAVVDGKQVSEKDVYYTIGTVGPGAVMQTEFILWNVEGGIAIGEDTELSCILRIDGNGIDGDYTNYGYIEFTK